MSVLRIARERIKILEEMKKRFPEFSEKYDELILRIKKKARIGNFYERLKIAARLDGVDILEVEVKSSGIVYRVSYDEKMKKEGVVLGKYVGHRDYIENGKKVRRFIFE